MTSKRKFWAYEIKVQVLSEDPIDEDTLCDLDVVNHGITEGDWSGKVTVTKSQEVNGKKMAKLLMAQASDPGFFQLTEKGEDTEED